MRESIAPGEGQKKGTKPRRNKMAHFVKLEDHFLAPLGVVAGEFHVDGYNPSYEYALDDSRDLLNWTMDAGLLTSDEAKKIDVAMTEAGLAEEATSVIQKIKDHQLPDDFQSELSFQLCNSCPLPIIHGAIVEEKSKERKSNIHTLKEGFWTLNAGWHLAYVNSNQALHILQQMITLELPLSAKEYEALFEALPQEVRDAYEEQKRMYEEEK